MYVMNSYMYNIHCTCIHNNIYKNKQITKMPMYDKTYIYMYYIDET